MAQGALKKRPSVGKSARAGKSTTSTASKSNPKAASRPSSLGPKRLGGRVIAPKKAAAMAATKITKKHSAGLTALTEKSLARKAGHLELLAGGKKESKEKGKAKGNEKSGKRKKH